MDVILALEVWRAALGDVVKQGCPLQEILFVSIQLLSIYRIFDYHEEHIEGVQASRALVVLLEVHPVVVRKHAFQLLLHSRDDLFFLR